MGVNTESRQVVTTRRDGWPWWLAIGGSWRTLGSVGLGLHISKVLGMARTATNMETDFNNLSVSKEGK